jgi:hypothetical protein
MVLLNLLQPHLFDQLEILLSYVLIHLEKEVLDIGLLVDEILISAEHLHDLLPLFGLPLGLACLCELVVIPDEIRKVVQIGGCVLTLVLTGALTLVGIADQGVKIHDCLIALPLPEDFLAGIDGAIIYGKVLGLQLELVLFLTIYNFRDNL